MKAQLLDRYLTESQYDNGIFLVGYFDTEDHDNFKNRSRKKPNGWKNITEAREELFQQAKELNQSHSNIEIASYVMDVHLGKQPSEETLDSVQ